MQVLCDMTKCFPSQVDHLADQGHLIGWYHAEGKDVVIAMAAPPKLPMVHFSVR